jgi:hypothetical protein
MYHDSKADISLSDFDDLIEELLDRVERREFLNDTDDLLDNALKPVEGIINAPLPQEWKTSFISINELDTSPRALVNLLHCPKNVSNGAQKTSSTGLAKSVGTEAALFGTFSISNTISGSGC